MSVYNAIKYDPINAGSLTLISTFTSDGSDATATFASGIDSTYKEYLFIINNIHPETDGANFLFQVDTGTNTSYNQTITSTFFTAFHKEDDATPGVEYTTSLDQGQGTAFQNLNSSSGNGNDECSSGTLRIFNPASGTFIKHFFSRFSSYIENDQMTDLHVAGYVNTTTALTRVQFKFNSGEIQAGTIGLFGVK